jgi:hypothetical protein
MNEVMRLRNELEGQLEQYDALAEAVDAGQPVDAETVTANAARAQTLRPIVARLNEILAVDWMHRQVGGD